MKNESLTPIVLKRGPLTPETRKVAPILSARKMAEALQQAGVEVIDYEESANRKLMDGEVSMGESLSVQVGEDYACLCRILDDDIDYLLEDNDLTNEVDFATKAAQFIKFEKSESAHS